jgi:hypothetical protein
MQQGANGDLLREYPQVSLLWFTDYFPITVLGGRFDDELSVAIISITLLKMHAIDLHTIKLTTHPLPFSDVDVAQMTSDHMSKTCAPQKPRTWCLIGFGNSPQNLRPVGLLARAAGT